MEFWDLYDENRIKLNKTHCRENKLQTEEFHVVVEIWTVNNKKEILTTLRHPNKKAYPNYWENTGGSVLTGETSKAGAIRELREEPGVIAEEDELIFLGTEKSDNIFFDIYMIKKDVDTINLRMQEGETIAAKWINLSEFNQMIESEKIVPTIIKRLNPYRQKFEELLYSK